MHGELSRFIKIPLPQVFVHNSITPRAAAEYELKTAGGAEPKVVWRVVWSESRKLTWLDASKVRGAVRPFTKDVSLDLKPSARIRWWKSSWLLQICSKRTWPPTACRWGSCIPVSGPDHFNHEQFWCKILDSMAKMPSLLTESIDQNWFQCLMSGWIAYKCLL